MRLHRGLALMLLLFGIPFAVLAPHFATGHGPAKTAAEALRRFEAATRTGDAGMAVWLGDRALTLAHTEADWAGTKLAGLEYRLARTQSSLGRKGDALELLRDAGAHLDGSTTDTALLVEITQARADLALATGRKMEAACTYGLALERLGPDHISHIDAAAKPDPALRNFADDVIAAGERFANGEAPAPAAGETWPLTSCNLLAEFYAARGDYGAADAVSRTVVAYARTDKTLGPEMRAGLMRRAGEIALGHGDVAAAGALFDEAVAAAKTSNDKLAYLSALERQASYMSSYGQSAKALPILERVIAMHQTLEGRRTRGLIPPLIALGYAQLDTAKPHAAEATFKRAIALAKHTRRQEPAELTATMGLAEVYEDQSRTIEAKAMRARMTQMQKAGIVPMPIAGAATTSP